MSIPIQITPRSVDALNSLSPQAPVDAASDHLGGLVVSELFGKYYNLTRAGMVFVASNGGAIPASGTAVKFCFWNPSGSGVNLVPLRWSMGYSGATQTAGVNASFSLQTIFAGGEIGTVNAPVSAFTAVTNGLDNSSINRYVIPSGIAGNPPGATAGRPSKIRVGSSATLTAAGALVTTHVFPISQQAVATTGTSVIGPLIEDFEGTLIYGQGSFTAFFSSPASGDLWNAQLIWAEVPV